MPMPLEGIRVIDWTIWQQGPMTAAMRRKRCDPSHPAWGSRNSIRRWPAGYSDSPG